MSEDTKLVEAIFLEAIDRSRVELNEFLDKRCNGDEEVKKQVLELLAAHDQTGSFRIGATVDGRGQTSALRHGRAV